MEAKESEETKTRDNIVGEGQQNATWRAVVKAPGRRLSCCQVNSTTISHLDMEQQETRKLGWWTGLTSQVLCTQGSGRCSECFGAPQRGPTTSPRRKAPTISSAGFTTRLSHSSEGEQPRPPGRNIIACEDVSGRVRATEAPRQPQRLGSRLNPNPNQTAGAVSRQKEEEPKFASPWQWNDRSLPPQLLRKDRPKPEVPGPSVSMPPQLTFPALFPFLSPNPSALCPDACPHLRFLQPLSLPSLPCPPSPYGSVPAPLTGPARKTCVAPTRLASPCHRHCTLLRRWASRRASSAPSAPEPPALPASSSAALPALRYSEHKPPMPHQGGSKMNSPHFPKSLRPARAPGSKPQTPSHLH